MTSCGFRAVKLNAEKFLFQYTSRSATAAESPSRYTDVKPSLVLRRAPCCYYQIVNLEVMRA